MLGRRIIGYVPMLVLLALVGGCGSSLTSRPPSQTRECQPEALALLIDKAAFPEGWNAGNPSRPADRHGAVHRCGRDFTVTNGVAFQEVYEYRSLNAAANEYERQLGIFFSTNPSYTSAWEMPPSMPQYEYRAEEFRLACAVKGETLMCALLARYANIIARFNTHMSPDFMTEDDLFLVLQAIDDKIVAATCCMNRNLSVYFVQ